MPGRRPSSGTDSAAAFHTLVLENVRCFSALRLPLYGPVTLIIGENGAGKTTIAESLASLCAGADEGLPEFPLRRGARRGKIALLDEAGKEVASWTAGVGGTKKALPAEHYLFAYGRYRRVHGDEGPLTFDADTGRAAPAPAGPEASLTQDLSRAVFSRRTTTLFRPNDLLQRGLRQFLIYMHENRAADPRFEAVWRGLEASLKGSIERLAVLERADRLVPVMIRDGVETEFRELSDGYQSILSIVFDLILRYTYIFPGLDNPLLGPATVVIDEVDLHLHPRWQRQVVRQLRRLFPETHFVLTTHSAAVVQDAIDEGLRVVVLHTGPKGVSARVLGEPELGPLRHAAIGSVLVEDKLFDVPSRYSPEVEEKEKEVRALREKAEAGEASAEERKTLLRDLEQLQLYLVAEEERRARGPLLSEIAKIQMAFLKDLDKKLGAQGNGSTTAKRGGRPKRVAGKRQG